VDDVKGNDEKNENVPEIDSTQSTICTFNTVGEGEVVEKRAIARDGSNPWHKKMNHHISSRVPRKSPTRRHNS